MDEYCVLIETKYKNRKNISGDEKEFAKAVGYTLSRWKRLAVETRLRKMIQVIFDGSEASVHVLNVMKAEG